MRNLIVSVALACSCLLSGVPVLAQELERPTIRSRQTIELFTMVGTTIVPQVLTPNLTAGEPFHVQANHTGTDTASYSLVLDGVVVETKPVTALAAGVIDFFRPAGTTAGSHTAVVRATGTGTPALVTNSTTLTFTVDPLPAPAPPAFTNIRIIR